MKTLYSALLCIWLLVTAFLAPVQAEDTRDTSKLIRIGLVDTLDLKEEFSHHMLQQYLHAYLDEVSKQNHWQYDYFTGSLEECLRRLRKGELDFVCPVQVDSDLGDDLVFSAGFSCYGLLSVYGAADDPRSGRIRAINGASVGILNHEDNLRAFSYYLSENDWHADIRAFDLPQDMMAALKNHEIDAVVDDGTHVTASEQRILTFAVVPAQFITIQKNKWLNDMLTDAVLTSETLNPSFETELEAEYLDKALQNIVRHTDAEYQYIEHSPVLRVAFLPNLLPLYDAHEHLEDSHGIYIDLLKMIANISGMRFELKQAATADDLKKMLADDEADMAFAVYTNEKSPVNMNFTNEFRKEEFSVVRRRRESDGRVEKGRGIAAMPVTFPGTQNYLQHRYGWRIHPYATVAECLDALEREECEVAILPTLYLQRENSMVLHASLQVMDDEELRIPISMAISPHHPQILQRVMNTAILRLNREQVARLVREDSSPRFSIGYILHQYPLQMAIFLCLILGGFAVIAFILYRNATQKKQNRILQQKNRELQVALDNVESMRVSRDDYKLKSRTDVMTGLFNKKATEHICQRRLSELSPDKLAALFILDLDHFKEANDTYGHQAGDTILKDFAKALRHIFRTDDCVGRFGGDEFVVFLTDLPNQDIIRRKAAQILAAARSLSLEGTELPITSSIGIAIAPNHGTDYEKLFHVADQALYKVKTGGRNGYAIGPEDEIIR